MNSRWNEQFLGSFWRKEKKSIKLAGTSRSPNVATSGQREEEVNKWPQCRDVSAISASPSLKEKGTRNLRGIEIRMDEGTEKEDQ